MGQEEGVYDLLGGVYDTLEAIYGWDDGMLLMTLQKEHIANTGNLSGRVCDTPKGVYGTITGCL